jgi:eukaryotic-like serine/threonine-protein kinase
MDKHGCDWQALGVRPGELLGGRYRIEGTVGAGGMGVVIAARQVLLDEKVAIKVLHPRLRSDARAAERFVREAKAATRIRSDHVARVLDVAILEDGTPYIVMEYLEGSDLAGILAERGRFSVEQAVDLVLQVCVAVAEAHRAGIVHRDLKPSNLFCVPRRDGGMAVKVLDFGISKVDGKNTPAPITTLTGSLMGSPHYMSPEQMQSSREVDGRSDIWALGVILYQLLVGSVPFAGTTITDVAIRVATQMPAPLGQRRPDVAPGLEAAILRCLEKEPGARYATVAELAAALARWGPARTRTLMEHLDDRSPYGALQGSSEKAASLDAAALEPTLGEFQTIAPLERGGPLARRGTRILVALSAAVGVMACCAVFLRGTVRARPNPETLEPGQTSPPQFESQRGPSGLSPEPFDLPAPEVSHVEAATFAEAREKSSKPNPAITHSAVRSNGPRAAPQTSGSAAVAPTSERAATSCNPPYFVDAQGNRVFRAECVR